MSRPSSLKDYDRLADRIRLHMQASTNPVLIVEGRADEGFCRRHLDFELDIFIAGSRNSVLSSTGELVDAGVRRFAGLVDRDFDDLVAVSRSRGFPIVAYDGADLEGMLFFSPALEHLLHECASERKLSEFGGVRELRQSVVDLAMPISRLRRANATSQWGMRFDAVDPSDRMKVTRLTLDVGGLVDALLACSPDCSASRADALAASNTSDELRCDDTGTYLIRGRDALAILGVFLRRAVGTLSRDESRQESLARALRLAAQGQDIRGTAWYERLGEALTSSNPQPE